MATRKQIKAIKAKQNNNRLSFRHADIRTGGRKFHIGKFEEITIKGDDQAHVLRCKGCGGLEADDRE